MKVLHLVAGGLTGGAARGAYWLHRGLRDLGIDSFLLNSGLEKSDESDVASLAETSLDKLKLMLLPRIGGLPKYLYSKRKPWIFNTGFEGVDFTNHPAYREADILHLHWINGLVAMRALQKIKKPIVWTMRDMWPFTGGCHVGTALSCTRYEVGCGSCPQLGSKYKWDLTAAVVKNKQISLPTNMRVVGISNWLSDCARKSTVFKDFKICTISNNIDTNEFSPIDSSVARKILGLPQNKKIVLLGALSMDDAHKGFDQFLAAMDVLQQKDVEVVVFGRISSEIRARLKQSSTFLGVVSDVVALRLIYSAADVFVAPSLVDSFGKTLAESMSCGTPVVCFDATGPADIVDHRVTGYKATPYVSADLACGIDWVLSLCEFDKSVMRKASRERAIARFDVKVIAPQYIQLYEEIIQDKA
jgi:glycosyltransferase involved in cell wall biosynthesis